MMLLSCRVCIRHFPGLAALMMEMHPGKAVRGSSAIPIG
jgi:hypothetical protein